MSTAEPMDFYTRAGHYLSERVDYFTWTERKQYKRLTGPQWRRLQHKGRSPRGTRGYYQHAANKGHATPRRSRRGPGGEK